MKFERDGEIVELRKGRSGRLVASVDGAEVHVASHEDAPGLAIEQARARRRVRRSGR